MPLSQAGRQELMRSLGAQHGRYNPVEKMLVTEVGPDYQYHTNLRSTTAHSTRQAVTYAATLLDTLDPELEARACEIIARVIALQDRDMSSPTFGTWGWYMEEPPAQMATPDFNWADFLGVQLLHIALHHRARLPAALASEIDDTIRRAAQSIRQRNARPGYTNIAIMGTYVTLVAAEEYGDADLKNYALKRLREFAQYTAQQGAFTEYNSPTYTLVALQELARMRRDVRTPEAKPLIEELYRVAWQEIAGHFHAPTRQWAGPHSRAYTDLVGVNVLQLIERSTSEQANFGLGQSKNPDDQRLPTPCPPDMEAFFISLDAPHELVKTFVRGDKPIVGTSYLHPQFALGTINRGDMWNQRRPLLAYWGTARQPFFLRLRVLHDGYDFAAARFWGVQREGLALAAINFATDGGDKHIHLDPIQNATISAQDLRLSFEIGGAVGEADSSTQPLIAPANLATPISLRFGDLRVTLAVPHARFGEYPGHWEIARRDEKLLLDVVLYASHKRTFKLDELASAALAVVVQFALDDVPLPAVSVEVNQRFLSLGANDLKIMVPIKPSSGQDLDEAAELKLT